MSHAIRPILYPPKGGIGGHCIIQNAKILSCSRGIKSQAIDLALKYQPKKYAKKQIKKLPKF